MKIEFIGLGQLLTRFSTIVMFVVSGVIYWWLGLSMEEQQYFINKYPLVKEFAPLVSLGAFLLARGIKQKGE